jgi:hypothetical protein
LLKQNGIPAELLAAEAPLVADAKIVVTPKHCEISHKSGAAGQD